MVSLQSQKSMPKLQYLHFVGINFLDYRLRANTGDRVYFRLKRRATVAKFVKKKINFCRISRRAWSTVPSKPVAIMNVSKNSRAENAGLQPWPSTITIHDVLVFPFSPAATGLVNDTKDVASKSAQLDTRYRQIQSHEDPIPREPTKDAVHQFACPRKSSSSFLILITARWRVLVLRRDIAMHKEPNMANSQNNSFVLILRYSPNMLSEAEEDEHGVPSMPFVNQHFVAMVGARKEGEEDGYVSESIRWASGDENKRHSKEYRNDVVLAVFRSEAIFTRLEF
ncbi:hypothetical protein ARMSODRAFT_1062552 [Armillaria solidipes]|uniref:Uncharacterized protein n=1 Tax=Armillaria solidipes TaxID=1076256 RepID=A0A2H3BFG4_9AGAR|nr:hypothetical protein ARMSODRAFT_1062552 [Armillaria solidipes]